MTESMFRTICSAVDDHGVLGSHSMKGLESSPSKNLHTNSHCVIYLKEEKNACESECFANQVAISQEL